MSTQITAQPKIAIIGASTGQLPLVKKAKQLGIYTICFAWEKGAVCKEECDEYYPISIFDTDKIVCKCLELKVDGVTTTASEETSLTASIIADRLGLNCTSPEIIRLIQNKDKVRKVTDNVEGLSKPKIWTSFEKDKVSYPCVVKPIKGSAKRGVSFCNDESDLENAIDYAKSFDSDILIEEYIPGNEYSVESLSFHGEHHVVQITRKVTTGYPHFAELEHHQPAQLDSNSRKKIVNAVTGVLTKVGYTDGASHIEVKINPNGIYLIEINPRGGGDRISDTLVGLSTDCDYLRGMLDISLNRYKFSSVRNISYSGILYLTAQNSRILKYFSDPCPSWMVERQRFNQELTESHTNYERDGYFIYNSKEPIEL